MKLKIDGSLLFFGLFALIGTVFAIAAYLSWQSTQRIVQTGIETKGLVIDTRYSRDKKGRTTTAQAPVVQFVTSAGKPITYYSQTYTTPASFNVGDTVTLWYMPDNPQEDITLEGVDGWLLPGVFGLFGVVFSLIGYPTLISSVFKAFKG
ncbi:DUF3592 domain-containing protein [Spirosoma endbachense]|uniref:DUF3592 domain-containing protein n=1 Tax=Spirosoma endbachense TaxID=2666025 RepID=A0A6P1VQM7_9BACT|nr:DUF3592 domain-containing protein [Spirosoma endbachense]QHV93666.1 DUF3592 domain-containing protein [Spirosoma endbachense]